MKKIIKLFFPVYFMFLFIYFYGCTNEREIYKSSFSEKFIFIQIIDEKGNPVKDAAIYSNGVKVDYTDFNGISILKVKSGKIKIDIQKKYYEKYSKIVIVKGNKLDLKIELKSYNYYKNKIDRYILNGEYNKAFSVYNKYFKNIVIEKSIIEYMEVYLYIQSGKLNEADEKLSEMIDKYNDDRLFLTRVVIFMKTGKYKKAINSYLKLINKDELKYFYLYKEIGLIYINYLKDPGHSIYYFKKYLQFIDDEKIENLIENIK